MCEQRGRITSALLAGLCLMQPQVLFQPISPACWDPCPPPRWQCDPLCTCHSRSFVSSPDFLRVCPVPSSWSLGMQPRQAISTAFPCPPGNSFNRRSSSSWLSITSPWWSHAGYYWRFYCPYCAWRFPGLAAPSLLLPFNSQVNT